MKRRLKSSKREKRMNDGERERERERGVEREREKVREAMRRGVKKLKTREKKKSEHA